MNIKLLVLDVDGTMTDGGIYFDANGVESKKFNVKDGLGIKLARDAGIDVLIVTGRESPCVTRRAEELGVTHLAQGIGDKKAYLEKFSREYGLRPEEIAYIGDDLPDLPAMRLTGFSACPADACREVQESAHYVSTKKGGDGAVREIVERLIKSKS